MSEIKFEDIYVSDSSYIAEENKIYKTKGFKYLTRDNIFRFEKESYFIIDENNKICIVPEDNDDLKVFKLKSEADEYWSMRKKYWINSLTKIKNNYNKYINKLKEL